MPFESQAQRRFMYATNPKMAKRFEKKTKKKNLPEKVKKSPMDLAWRLLKRETHPGESIAHFLGHDTDYFDDQDFYDRMYLDRGEGPLIHYNPKTGEGRAQLNPDARLYHPAIHPSHADENMFPDRKIVTRPDGTKEELVASSKHVLEDTKPVFDESGQLSYVETTPMPTFQNIPFSEETGFTKAERQTELGEFHEDFPSSLGPVTEYHGTMNLPAVSEQGIKARSSRKRSKKYVPEQLRGQDITYTTPDRERALAFAQERAQSLGLPSSQVGVVGVRAGGLPSPIQHQEPFGVLGGTMSNVRPSAIPRANIALLKRQTELGEFHPDLPSSHGPVKYYHGTPETNVQQIMRQGLRANRNPYKNIEEYVQAMEDGSYDKFMENYDPTYRGAFVTTKPERAHRYAERKGWSYRPIPAPALIGVREGAGMPEEYIGYGDDTGEDTKRLFPDDYRFMDDVDPKFLTQIKEGM